METVTGSVEKIIFQSPDSEYKIFLLRKRDKSLTTVQGEFPNLLISARLEVHGRFVTHNKYGSGFKADAFSFIHDQTSSGLLFSIGSSFPKKLSYSNLWVEEQT